MMSLIHDIGRTLRRNISAYCARTRRKTARKAEGRAEAFPCSPKRGSRILLACGGNTTRTPPRKPARQSAGQGRKPSSSTIRDATRFIRFNLGCWKRILRERSFCANSARFWTKKPPPSSTVQVKRSHPKRQRHGNHPVHMPFLCLTGTTEYSPAARFPEGGGGLEGRQTHQTYSQQTSPPFCFYSAGYLNAATPALATLVSSSRCRRSPTAQTMTPSRS